MSEDLVYDYTLIDDKDREYQYIGEEQYYVMKKRIARFVSMGRTFSVIDNEFGDDVTSNIAQWYPMLDKDALWIVDCAGQKLYSIPRESLPPNAGVFGSDFNAYTYIRENYPSVLRNRNLT